MSLETAGFIKDLVSTNPEGTDPKSQGDDHLRMLKAVLKAQFSGFTEGLGILLTETNLNRLGGMASTQAVLNLDTVVPYTCFLGVHSGSTGTKPPGATAGQVIINMAYSSGFVYQYCQVGRLVWTRFFNATAWTAWDCQSPMGLVQAWSDFTPSRVLGTTYTNDTGRPIMVAVVVSGSTVSRSFATLLVNSSGICVVTTNEINNVGGFVVMTQTVNGVIPPGATYSATVSGGGGNMVNWRELR